MDYLDPKKEHNHRLIMLIGYVFVAVAIVFATIILIYRAYGFGIAGNGNVIQNGLTYFVSRPVSADIYINEDKKGQTSSRFLLPSGSYKFRLSQTGYRDWLKDVFVPGGGVQNFYYPLLIPKELKTATMQSYILPPSSVSQSPDRKSLLVQKAESLLSYDLFDLKNPLALPLQLTVPATVYTVDSSSTWTAIDWADDNRHILIRHDFARKSEYLLLDTQNINASLNLNAALVVSGSDFSFRDNKFDQYYLLDSNKKSLATISLSNPLPVVVVDQVLSFSTLGSDQVAYFTDKSQVSGKTALMIYRGGKSYVVRYFMPSSSYLTRLANYNGFSYLVASSTVENRAFIFKDPTKQLQSLPVKQIAPIQVLRVIGIDHLSFSPEFQYILAGKDNQIAIYDIENHDTFNYKLRTSLDAPQVNVSWIDTGHLGYVANGISTISDFDGSNIQALVTSNPSHGIYLSSDFKNIFVFDRQSDQATILRAISLVMQP